MALHGINLQQAIYNIQEKDGGLASTNGIAKLVNTAPASVTDMLNRLSGKGLLIYEKYKGVQLSTEGKKTATELTGIRSRSKSLRPLWNSAFN